MDHNSSAHLETREVEDDYMVLVHQPRANVSAG